MYGTHDLEFVSQNICLYYKIRCSSAEPVREMWML